MVTKPSRRHQPAPMFFIATVQGTMPCPHCKAPLGERHAGACTGVFAALTTKSSKPNRVMSDVQVVGKPILSSKGRHLLELHACSYLRADDVQSLIGQLEKWLIECSEVTRDA